MNESPDTAEIVAEPTTTEEIIAATPPSPAVEETPESIEEQIDWKARAESLTNQVETLRVPLQKYEQIFQQLEQEELNRIANELTTKVSTPETPIAPQDRQALETLLRDGATYRRAAPQLRNEFLSAAALHHARNVVGEDATVKELLQTANELYDLGDERLMEKLAPRLQKERQSTTAQTRLATGADRLTPAAATSSGATDFNSLENEFSRDGWNMAPRRLELYLKTRGDRKAAGLL